MPHSPQSLRLLGKSFALLALTGLLAYGCDRAQPPKATPTAPAKSDSPTPPDAASAPKPMTPPAAGPNAAAQPGDKAGEKPKLPPISHTELARDAKPIREWVTPTGVTVQEFKEGAGFPTLPKAVVTRHFVMYLKDGWKKIQSTWEDGEPETEGLEQTLDGLTDGLLGMKAGGMRRIIVPPARGFGKEDVKDLKDPDKIAIPAGSTLIFDVDLISIKQTIMERPAPKVQAPDKKDDKPTLSAPSTPPTPPAPGK